LFFIFVGFWIALRLPLHGNQTADFSAIHWNRPGSIRSLPDKMVGNGAPAPLSPDLGERVQKAPDGTWVCRTEYGVIRRSRKTPTEPFLDILVDFCCDPLGSVLTFLSSREKKCPSKSLAEIAVEASAAPMTEHECQQGRNTGLATTQRAILNRGQQAGLESPPHLRPNRTSRDG